MIATEFFTKAGNWLDRENPFVLFRKPGSPASSQCTVEAYFQKDAQLYDIKDFTETGFVFAPFDLKNASILIPSDQSENLTTTVDLSAEFPPSSAQDSEKNSVKSTHINLVNAGIQAIKQRDLEKVVLSRKRRALTERSPLNLFKRLLAFYPEAYVYCWFHPKVGLWLGATPETLLNVSGKTLTTVSLAGTKSAENDAKPNWTVKEIEEQQLVTDFIKNTLKGKVTNLSIRETETVRAGNLWHLKNDITARLNRKDRLGDIIRAIHPTPAVCGLPKESAKAFILNHEPYNREFYAGFLGELNKKKRPIRRANRRNIEHQAFSGNIRETDLYVNLRCMQMQDRVCSLYVGGGIVRNSDPESEWQETVHKSITLLEAL